MNIAQNIKPLLVLGFIGLGIGVAVSCHKDEPTPTPAPLNIEFKVPTGWPAPNYTFQNNTLTTAGFILGRKLFYDSLLSKNNTISCSSCHQQFAAFSHLNHPLSHGIYGLFGTRNAPGLFNLNWQKAFFWDGGVNSIEVQPLTPITNPVEMDETIDHVVQKLSATSYYPSLFKSAFGDETINSQHIFKALAQFVGMLVSSNSRYDKYVRGEQGANYTPSELNGLNLFRNNCVECHAEPLFTNFLYSSHGLPIDSVLKDLGRMRITNDNTDSLKFKVPSLRNVGLTKPYMHDGRFHTLQEVLDQYDVSGFSILGKNDPLLKLHKPLSASDKTDIINFLQTLTDNDFIQDERFKRPN